MSTYSLDHQKSSFISVEKILTSAVAEKKIGRPLLETKDVRSGLKLIFLCRKKTYLMWSLF